MSLAEGTIPYVSRTERDRVKTSEAAEMQLETHSLHAD